MRGMQQTLPLRSTGPFAGYLSQSALSLAGYPFPPCHPCRSHPFPCYLITSLVIPRYETARSGLSGRDASAADRLPPLRELIWRRLRRRTAPQGGGPTEEDATGPGAEPEVGPGRSGAGGASTDRSRHREMLSWMVDQLTIDHDRPGGGGDAELPDYGGGVGHHQPGRSVPPPPPHFVLPRQLGPGSLRRPGLSTSLVLMPFGGPGRRRVSSGRRCARPAAARRP